MLLWKFYLLTLAGIVVLLVWRRHLKKKKDNMAKGTLSNDECASAVDLTLFPEVKDNSEESLLIHCPAWWIEVSRYVPTCPLMRTFDLLDKASQQETVIKVIPTDQRKPESTRETTGCLSSFRLCFFGSRSRLFNFIGYFIVLVILTLCGVFSFGEAVFYCSLELCWLFCFGRLSRHLHC